MKLSMWASGPVTHSEILIWSVCVFIDVDCLLGMYLQISMTIVIIFHFLLLYICSSIFGSILCPFNLLIMVDNEVQNKKKAP